MPDQALEGIKVLDISHHIAGPYCTKLLGDYGAQVIKVEKPEGDPARTSGPFRDDRPDPEGSGLFLYLNNNKLGATLDLKSDTGKKLFKELVEDVDILVENFSPKVMPGLGLGFDTLKALNPGLVMTSISNFGQTGPYRDYKATDIVLQALGGLDVSTRRSGSGAGQGRRKTKSIRIHRRHVRRRRHHDSFYPQNPDWKGAIC